MPERSKDSAAQGLFVFKAEQPAHSRLCEGCHNAEDGKTTSKLE